MFNSKWLGIKDKDAHFPKSYDLIVDRIATNEDLFDISSQQEYPWSDNENTPLAVATSGKSARAFFCQYGMLLANKIEGGWVLDFTEAKSIKFEVECGVSSSGRIIKQEVIMKTGLFGRITITAEVNADKIKALPEPFDAFLACAVIDRKMNDVLFTVFSSLRSFSGNKPDIAYSNVDYSIGLGKMLTVAISSILLPITFDIREVQSDCHRIPCADFVDCLPGLLVYLIGMNITSAKNFEKEGLSVSDHLDEFGEASVLLAEYSNALLLLHGRSSLINSLESLSISASEWVGIPYSSKLKKYMLAWRDFAHMAKDDFSEKQGNALNSIFKVDQIDDYIANIERRC